MTAVWSTNTDIGTGTGRVLALPYGSSLSPGDSIDSANALYRLQFQIDGNLVLLKLPSQVLWATATEGMSATNVDMQLDGNLVVYASGTPLWASFTDDSPGGYLVLQDDGNLVIYNYGGVEQIGVMSLEPDWVDGMTETLTWLTSVTESPLAVEQRTGLRMSPRKMLELSHTLFGPKRTYFDLLTIVAAGSPMYLPLFYDRNRTTLAVEIGDTIIPVDTTFSELQDCRRIILISDHFSYEVIEVWNTTDDSVVTIVPLEQTWEKGTLIYPLKKVKVETQAQGQRHADRAYKSRTRFLSLEPNPSKAETTFGSFLDQLVLEDEPNEAEPLGLEYDRKWFSLDQQFGLQTISDVAPFNLQNYSWFAKGREALWKLRGLFYTLQGKRRPAWIPTYFADFDLALAAGASDTTISVKRCGYSDIGGPVPEREFILIHLRNGTRIYKRIMAAALVGGGLIEELSLDGTVGFNINPDNVLRISFLVFSRLDADSIELVHPVDSRGLTTVNSVFRTDPGIEPWLQKETPNPASPIVIDPFKESNFVVFEVTILTTGSTAFGAGGYSACIGYSDGSFQLDNPHELDFNISNPDMAGGVFWSAQRGGNSVGWGDPRAASGPFMDDAVQTWMFVLDLIHGFSWRKNVSHDDTQYYGDGGAHTPDPIALISGLPFGKSDHVGILGQVMTGNLHILGGVAREAGTGVPSPRLSFNTAGPFLGSVPPGYHPYGSTQWNPSDVAPHVVIEGDGVTIHADDTITENNQASYFVRSIKSRKILT